MSFCKSNQTEAVRDSLEYEYNQGYFAKDLAPLMIEQLQNFNAKFKRPVIKKEKTEFQNLWERVLRVAYGRCKSGNKEMLEIKLSIAMFIQTIYICQERELF